MTETPAELITIEDVRQAYMEWHLSQKEMHKRHAQVVLKRVLAAAKEGRRCCLVALAGDEYLYLLTNGEPLRAAIGPEFEVKIGERPPVTVSVSWNMK